MSYVFTSQTFYIAQGDTLPTLDYVPMDATGAPVPVVPGATVVFSMRRQGSNVATIDRSPALVVAEETPFFRYEWRAGDTDIAGVYEAEFEWDNAGRPETFPNHDDAVLLVRIRDDVA